MLGTYNSSRRGFPNRGSQIGKRQQIGLTITAVFAVGLCLSITAAWPFTTDDAYITLRYASNWANHGQLNWNLDDPVRVEGYSSSLFLVLSFIAFKLSIDPVAALKLAGLFGLVGTLMFIFLLARLFTTTLNAILAITLFGSYFGTVWWTVSGLETSVYIFFVLASVGLFFESERSGRLELLIASGVLVFLAGMTRPEGPLIGIVIAVAMLGRGIVERQPLRLLRMKMWRLAVPFVFLYVLYFLVRYSHFGAVWPNSLYCKINNSEAPWTLISMFLGEFGAFLAFGLLGFLDRKSRLFVTLAYAFIGIMMVGIYGVDPEIAHENRHSLASLAFTSIVLAIGMQAAVRRKPALVQLLVLGLIISNLYSTIDNRIPLRLRAVSYSRRMEARVRLADYIKELNVQNYAMGDAGIVPFLTPGRHVFDYYGLNSKEFTSTEISKRIDRYADFLVARSPDAVVIISRDPRMFVPYNPVQEELRRRFDLEGYVDSGMNFGAPESTYNYRVLLKASAGR